MGLKPCTMDFMLATVDGMGLSHNWFPRIAAEAFLESTKDGEIARSPDPVTLIDGDLSWLNNSQDSQHVFVTVLRAPRSVVVQSPGTVVIHDAWSWAVGSSPSADYPSVIQDTFGGRMQFDRSSVVAEDLKYCRQFYDGDSSQVLIDVGEVESMESLHFRYLAAVQTPGVWTTPTEFDPRWEANARWARLTAFAVPVVTS